MKAEAFGRNAHHRHESWPVGQSLPADTSHPGTDSGDLMLVVTYSGPLPAPPKASTVPRGSCPHPTPARVCVLAPPPLTQQDRQRFWAETLAEAHYMDALGMMGEVNALHVCREAEL